MKKIIFFSICMAIFTFSAYAGGKVELTIENKTGKQITQIIVNELESSSGEIKKTNTINKSIENNTSTKIKLEKGILYGIVLVDTDERQYAKKRQTWEEETATISFVRKDILDRNILDKANKVILWPSYL